MKTLKKILKPIRPGGQLIKSFALVHSNGRDIEVGNSIPRPNYNLTGYGNTSPEVTSSPRLVVDEPLRTQNPIIAKTRSEISGLNTFLRTITSTPAKA